MDDLLKPKIDLKQQPTISCENCNKNYFIKYITQSPYRQLRFYLKYFM